MEWLHGDGQGLGVLDDRSVDGCFSHVVFQHIPDPAITLNYVREMGRVLRPGGWALFQVSTDPRPQAALALRARARRLLSGEARDHDPAWWGSAVEPGTCAPPAARRARVEQVLGEGTQYTTVFARRRFSRLTLVVDRVHLVRVAGDRLDDRVARAIIRSLRRPARAARSIAGHDPRELVGGARAVEPAGLAVA